MRARRAACASYALESAHVVRGFSTSAGTPGQLAGTAGMVGAVATFRQQKLGVL